MTQEGINIHYLFNVSFAASQDRFKGSILLEELYQKALELVNFFVNRFLQDAKPSIIGKKYKNV
jgi:hypothetical protein